MKVIATDADEPGNENSQIAYTIVDQNPPNDMFSMTKDGTIYVKRPDLDREVWTTPTRTQGQCFLYVIL